MSFHFRPATTIHERHGLFVALAGGTNSGKSYSALRLARGIAGPGGKVAALDTEGGRLLHLKREFAFDVAMIEPPHRPEKYADAAKAAEDAGYDCVVIDSFSMEWVGMGGVLDWQATEYERMGAREAVKLASWIKPKMGHKAMIYSLLQRRIPIIFSLRAEEKAKKDGRDVKSEWMPICNKAFPFEVTVSFMLSQGRQGVIDLSLPHKMEGAHREIFRDGDQLSERHGEALRAWAAGGASGQQAAAPAGNTETAAAEQRPSAPAQPTNALPLQTSTGTAMYERGGQWLDALQDELKTAAKARAATAAWQANAAMFERLAERAPAAMVGAFEAVKQLADELMDEERG